MNAYPERILAFSGNSQSLCRIGFAGESSDNGDLSAASAAKQTQEFGFIGKVGQARCLSLNALDDHRDALTAADARRRQAVTTIASMQLVQQRQHQPRARRAQRMTERDRAAVHVRT